MTFFELTTEIKAHLGTSCWVSDPLDPSKNATRPCFSFRTIQQLFANCLQIIETEGANFIYAYPNANHPDDNNGGRLSHGQSNKPSGSTHDEGHGSNHKGGIHYAIPDDVDLLHLMIQY